MQRCSSTKKAASVIHNSINFTLFWGVCAHFSLIEDYSVTKRIFFFFSVDVYLRCWVLGVLSYMLLNG